MIVEEKFDKFTVYKDTEKHQFCYVTIREDSFYDDFASYLLDFSMIKKHATINLGIDDELSIDDYNEIYGRLISFVDFEKIYSVAGLDQSIISVLDDELIKDSADFRKDKWGRIGEYIFNVILDSYFKLDCIIRKFALNTSPNISVYGIDTLHCSLREHIFYFGESKMVGSLDNGITLICKSLEEYEAQISKEYYTIKNNNINKNEEFIEAFNSSLKRCLSFTDLIRVASLTTIGVPIFIAHGGKLDTKYIFEKMSTIPQKNLFGLETKYFFISVPIISKSKFRDAFIKVIRDKIEECRECLEKL